jgi:hypothetical protein
LDSKTQNPLGFVVVSVQNTTLMQLTKRMVILVLIQFPQKYIALVQSGFQRWLISVEITEGQMLDLEP